MLYSLTVFTHAGIIVLNFVGVDASRVDSFYFNLFKIEFIEEN